MFEYQRTSVQCTQDCWIESKNRFIWANWIGIYFLESECSGWCVCCVFRDLMLTLWRKEPNALARLLLQSWERLVELAVLIQSRGFCTFMFSGQKIPFPSVFRQHCVHVVHRCGLLLQMSHVVCLCVCVVIHDTQVSCANTTDSIKMPFWGWLMWVQGTIY